MTIKDLKPTHVWNAFYELTQIPRPSGHTEAVAKFLVDFAKQQGAEAHIDEGGNVVIRVAATPGYENRQMVVLQGHMDMVPQKTDDSKHDFLTDPITTIIDGDWVHADRTTLGADDGMGIAFGMAILSDKSIEHGPLEMLFTRDEETGMYGAFELKEDELQSKLMINIDSETEGEITIGCAGGMDINATLEYQEEQTVADGVTAFRISVGNLLGGHSGLEIHLSRANANKLMARVLYALINHTDALLSSWSGGNMRNAIPRTSEAVIIVPDENKDDVIRIVKEYADIIRHEYKDIEKEPVELKAEEVALPSTFVPEAIGVNLISAALAAQDGVMRYIPTMPEVVETSCNFAIVNIGGGKASFCLLARSANNTMKDYFCTSLTSCFNMAGMKVVLSGGYSGWDPNTSSPFVALMKDVYQKMYSAEPKVLVVHAGLECGIFGPKYPDMDMASVGPTLLSPHTPSERCHIPSVERSFNYICAILKAIPEV